MGKNRHVKKSMDYSLRSNHSCTGAIRLSSKNNNNKNRHVKESISKDLTLVSEVKSQLYRCHTLVFKIKKQAC